MFRQPVKDIGLPGGATEPTQRLLHPLWGDSQMYASLGLGRRRPPFHTVAQASYPLPQKHAQHFISGQPTIGLAQLAE